MKLRWSSVAAASAVALVVACGDGTAPQAETIGSQGGTIEHGDVALEIPAGALDEDVEITISTTAEDAPDGYIARSPIYRFEPAGLLFAAPAEVRIGFEGASEVAIVWSTSDGSGFESLTTELDGALAI